MIEPFQSEFFRNGLAVAVLAGALCGLLGVYVVLRGMSYIGHGLSHAIFGWAVVATVFKVNFYVGAGAGGFLSALLVNRVARRRIIGADAAIGVVTIGFFAVGLAVYSRGGSFRRNLDAALFGNVLGVEMRDVLLVAAVTVVTAFIIGLSYRTLLFTTFDPEVAEASGVKTGRADALLSLTLAAAIVVTMNILGVLLVAAALVIPPVIARMLTHSFAKMLWLSVIIGALGGLVGMYASWFLDISSGSSIVLVEMAVFVIVYTISGVLGRRVPLAVDVG
jgi:ABC-type Mn2+/Zn2+ transport system permease subunit